MSDHRNEMDALDTVEMPVRWSDVERRSRERPPEPPLRHRLAAGLVAFAVFLGAVAVLWLALRPEDRQPVTDEEPSPSAPAIAAGEQVLVTIYSEDMVDFDIYRMSPDGSGLTPVLADRGYRDSQAVLSPDGSKIAFVRSAAPTPNADGVYVHSGGSDIYVMDADGTDLVSLTSQPEGGATHDEPAWSPDGTSIAYRSNEARPLDIWVMDADGSNQRRLTDGGSNGEPVWSPDGTKVAFDSDRDRPALAFGLNVWVMNADGSDPVRLTDTEAGDIVTSWSPDGSQILFQRSEGHSDYAWDVWVMNTDGGHQRPLTDWPGLDAGALWSPDGTQLMFMSDRHIGEQQAQDIIEQDGSTSGPTAVYVMDVDGSNVVQIASPDARLEPSDWVEVP